MDRQELAALRDVLDLILRLPDNVRTLDRAKRRCRTGQVVV